MKRTPEWYEQYTARAQAWKTNTARGWNGNIEPVQIIGDASVRKAGGGSTPTVVTSPTPKFRNVKTDGYASKKEAARASQLRLMQEAGQIRNLKEQMQYELIPRQEGERACFYRADFVYDEFAADGWRQVVEDTKGFRTADYVIKRKLMLQVHGIRIRET